MLHNRIHWAKFYLTKAGLLESPSRGKFVITDAGRQLLARSPAKLDTEFLLRVPAFGEFYRRSQASKLTKPTAEAPPSTSTPEEVIEAAYNAVQAALRADLMDRILQNSPGFFERVIVELLVAMGYGRSTKMPPSNWGDQVTAVSTA